MQMFPVLNMGLESLSDDLLLDIMHLISLPPPSYLGHSRQRNDLLPFMRCCRRLYRLGEPILYRKLAVKTSRAIRRFIKTILAHPDLSDHVRLVIFTDGVSAKAEEPEVPQSPPKYISQSFMNSVIPKNIGNLVQGAATPTRKLRHFNHEELETIKAIITSLSPAKAPSWMEGVSVGAWMPLAALALCILPNVEDLQLEQCQDSWFAKLGQTRNLLSYPFPFAFKSTAKLRNLSISYERRTCQDGLFAIPASLLALPSLRKFSGDMIREVSWTNTTRDTKFSITSLRLDRSNFSPKALENLLNSCPELEFLKYEHDNEKPEDCDFQPKKFEGAVAGLKCVLRELVLYRTALDPGPQITEAQFGIIKLLKEFEKLTRLSITAQLLLGPQKVEGSRWFEGPIPLAAERQLLDSCLPHSLEHLKLKNCGDRIFEQVSALVEMKQVIVPNLKSVIIEFVHIRSQYSGRRMVERAWGNQLKFGADSKAVKDLDELCKEKGVDLDVWYN